MHCKQHHFPGINLNIICTGIIFLCTLLVPVVHADDQSDYSEDRDNFSKAVNVHYNNEQYDLQLTGLAIRTRFFLDIYSMAHYLGPVPVVKNNLVSADEIYASILQQKSIKQISIIFMRSLTAKQIRESLVDSIRDITAKSEYDVILPEIEMFKRAITGDVKENDEFILRWLPDGSLVSIFEGQEISNIKSENFARAMWSIWFNEDSVVKRESLIENLLTSS